MGYGVGGGRKGPSDEAFQWTMRDEKKRFTWSSGRRASQVGIARAKVLEAGSITELWYLSL